MASRNRRRYGTALDYSNLTDTHQAERLVEAHGKSLRYDHNKRQWFTYESPLWVQDPNGAVWRLAIDAARCVADEADRMADLELRKKVTGWSRIWQSKQGLQRVMDIAKQLPPVAIAGDWDRDPWLLAVKNGALDLRTGRRRQGKPEDLLTLSARVEWNSKAKCPGWERFLLQIFDHNVDLVDYVQRCVGYTLTGDTSEQVWWLLYGTGANGKSTFLRILNAVFGTYAKTIPFSMVTLPGRSIPDDVADLPGRRLVFASEAIEGARLNEARIKTLTGQDPLTARQLYGRWFTFNPHLKLWLCCNHKPSVRDTSLGFWRRVTVIPFLQSFQGHAANKQLDRMLMREREGILAWSVRGCAAWQREGLNPPPVITAASEEYRQESDQVAQFLTERCDEDSDGTCRASDLHRAYQAWGQRHGVATDDLLTSTKFGLQVSERFKKTHMRDGNVYQGVRLKESCDVA